MTDNNMCFSIEENQTSTYFYNKTIDNDKTIIITSLFYDSLPYVSSDRNSICGILMKLIAELSSKYGYRYRINYNNYFIK